MKKLIYVTILSALVFSACEKSKTGGCIDPLAINYESWADFDDGSCTFEADVVFFYDAITAYELNVIGFDRLDFYIEEEPGTFILVGNEPSAPSFIYAGIPNCYEDTYVTSPIQWYSSDNTIINYQVYGITYILLGLEVETLVDEYSFDLYANECAAVPIRFLTFQATNTNK
jgi:hypothetical protein